MTTAGARRRSARIDDLPNRHALRTRRGLGPTAVATLVFAILSAQPVMAQPMGAQAQPVQGTPVTYTTAN